MGIGISNYAVYFCISLLKTSIMKKTVTTQNIEAGSNEIQKVSVPKGATLVSVGHTGNQTGGMTLSFEGGDANATEDKFYQVYDSRMSIPGKYFPLEHSVSDQGTTFCVVEATLPTAPGIDIMETALVSFGNFLLRKYGTKMPLVADPKQRVPAEVTDADLANWRHGIEQVANEVPANNATV